MARRTQRQDKLSNACPDPWEAFAAELAAASLNDRQRAFVTAFIERPVAAAAARQAGYSVGRGRQTGYDLRNMPKIRRLIALGLAVEVRSWYSRAGITDPVTIRQAEAEFLSRI